MSSSPNINPNAVYYAVFCSGCGANLNSKHTDCNEPKDVYCSQCGMPKHSYVCYPDARLIEQFEFAVQPPQKVVKRSTKPLWS